jgi:uncharacterized protein YggU (UPF0235/DUF167 family)
MHRPSNLNQSVTHAKVRDNPHLIRCLKSKAILTNSQSELNKYREEREKQFKINQVISENEKIKSDLAEIKSLLKTLLKQR